MEAPKFTDDELSVISAVMPKADPVQIIAPIQGVVAKVAAYFEGLQREQAAVQQVAENIAAEQPAEPSKNTEMAAEQDAGSCKLRSSSSLCWVLS